MQNKNGCGVMKVKVYEEKFGVSICFYDENEYELIMVKIPRRKFKKFIKSDGESFLVFQLKPTEVSVWVNDLLREKILEQAKEG